MIGNAFVLAVRQISRNPLRSLLTVLGVVIGVMAVITMVTVGNGASQAIRTLSKRKLNPSATTS